MNFRLSTITGPVNRALGRVLVALASFTSSRLDNILTALTFLDDELDSFIEKTERANDRKHERAIESFNRESSFVVEERAYRADLDNDIRAAEAEVERARHVQKRVKDLLR